MVILSDIIINHGYASGDIYINSLPHYYEFKNDALLPATIVLQTSSEVNPQIILLDCSEAKKKKNTALLSIKSGVSKNISSVISIIPMPCKLIDLDDKFIYELDEMLLSDIDNYDIGTHLVTSADIQLSVNADTLESDGKLQLSQIDITRQFSVIYYDDFFLTELDKYTLSEL